MAKKISFQVNFTGGIISPGVMLSLLQEAHAARVSHVQLGLRQQLFLEVEETMAGAFSKGCANRNIACSLKRDASPNILSSYPATGLFTSDSWLREDVLKDIFSHLDWALRFKINISDHTQNLVPLFTGHINWVSSVRQHFWHLYIRLPKTQTIIRWRELIYTNDVAPVSKNIEMALSKLKELTTSTTDAENFLLEQVKVPTTFAAQGVNEEIQIPSFSLPYYEGFNQSEGGIWLGLYRRDQLFPVSFLMDVCTLCNETKIGELYATPWKSLIIKGIKNGDREKWNHVLGKYRINVRHAANELAWQVEDGDENGLLIKRTVIRHFDKEDVRTYGLSFGVQSKPTASMFGSIIIRKQQNKNPNRLRSLDRYDLLYTHDFNPNSSELILFRDGLEKEQLGVYIVSLCKMYYQAEEERFARAKAITKTESKPGRHKTVVKEKIYHCKHCLTVYEPTFGDPNNAIAPGTPFEKLPDNYTCALCESPKDDFVLKTNNHLHPELL